MKKTKLDKGITLVALIITIIVLLILAMVAIRAVTGDGIVRHAQSAKEDYSKAQAEEAVKLALNEWKIVESATPSAVLGDFLKEKFGEDKVKDNGDETYTVTTNGYDVIVDKNGNVTSISGTTGKEENTQTLVMSWTCSNGGTWSEAIPAGQPAQGDIVAKLYTTGEKVNITENVALDAYKLIIEGTGRMGTVATFESDTSSKFQSGYAWQKNIEKAYELEEQIQNGTLDLSSIDMSTIPVSPLIKEVEIKEGITSIPAGAFGGCINLSTFKMADSISDIERYAFIGATKLTNIKIPRNLTTIKNRAFFLIGLTNIEIPDNVVTIEDYAFDWTSPNKITIGKNVRKIGEGSFNGTGGQATIVKILIQDYSNCEVASKCFGATDAGPGVDDPWLDDGSVIYVLNEGMKNKLEGSYNPDKVTVNIVTEEQMNNI